MNNNHRIQGGSGGPAWNLPRANTAPTPRRSESIERAEQQGPSGVRGPVQSTMRRVVTGAWENRLARGQASGSDLIHGETAREPAYLDHDCFSRSTRGRDITFDHTVSAKLLQNIEEFNNRLPVQGKNHIYAPGYSTVIIPEDSTLKIGGEFINANHIRLHNEIRERIEEPVAIACGYPLREKLNKHFQMLFEKKPSVLSVLAESSELEWNMVEYFKQGGVYGDYHVTSTPKDRVNKNGLSMQCYELSIRKGEEEVVVPVVHAENWKDNTALGADKMTPLINLMNRIQIKDGADEPRLPLAHCRAGVGRTSQLIGAYLIAHNPNVTSAEGLIKDLKLSRGPWMAYVLDQQIELGRLAAMKGIPALIDQMESGATSNMRHIGYTGIPATPDDDFMTALGEAGCLFSHSPDIPPHHAEPHLAHDSLSKGALMLSVMHNGEAAQQILWNQSLGNQGRNIENGEIFEGTPLEFWRKEIAGRGVSCDSLRTTSIFPSHAAGDVGILTGDSGEKTQSDMAARGSTPQDIEEIFEFIKSKDLQVFRNKNEIYVGDMENERPILHAALEKSDNVMLEFQDQREGGLVRYTFENLRDPNKNPGCIGHRYSPPYNSSSIQFGSIHHILNHIATVADPRTMLDIISTHSIDPIDQRTNFDSDEEEHDSDSMDTDK
jgi:hypothetical protein